MTIDNKYKIGQEVIIKHINCKGFVTAIRIVQNGAVDYEISYYLGDNYMYTFMDAFQFGPVK